VLDRFAPNRIIRVELQQSSDTNSIKDSLVSENLHELLFVSARHQFVVKILEVGVAHVGEHFWC
jgi:hypothetical protein